MQTTDQSTPLPLGEFYATAFTSGSAHEDILLALHDAAYELGMRAGAAACSTATGDLNGVDRADRAGGLLARAAAHLDLAAYPVFHGREYLLSRASVAGIGDAIRLAMETICPLPLGVPLSRRELETLVAVHRGMPTPDLDQCLRVLPRLHGLGYVRPSQDGSGRFLPTDRTAAIIAMTVPLEPGTRSALAYLQPVQTDVDTSTSGA